MTLKSKLGITLYSFFMLDLTISCLCFVFRTKEENLFLKKNKKFRFANPKTETI